MTGLRCRQIAEVLTEAQSRFGWDGFVYSFTIATDWTEQNAVYVREESASMVDFLYDYRARSVQQSRHRLGVVRSDLPQTFEVAYFSDAPLDQKLAQLMTEYGWQSGMTFPQYGYGGALGLTTFLSCAARLDDRLVEDSIAYMAQWQMQLNAWARAVMERKNAARSLSQREAECLLLVAEGKTSKEISETIGIARRTVEFHIQNAMHKLGGTSRSQAAAILTQLSLPQLSASSTPQTRGIRRAKRSE